MEINKQRTQIERQEDTNLYNNSDKDKVIYKDLYCSICKCITRQIEHDTKKELFICSHRIKK